MAEEGMPEAEHPATPAVTRTYTLAERQATITAWMMEHGRAVRGFCVRLLGNASFVDDVVQQVFTNAFEDLDRFEARSTPRTWLLGIAHHRCLDALKREKRYAARFESDETAVLAFEAPAAVPAAGRDQARRTALLEECMSRLPPQMRAVVLLRLRSDATYQELERELRVSANTLQVRVSRALPLLRACLQKRGWDE